MLQNIIGRIALLKMRDASLCNPDAINCVVIEYVLLSNCSISKYYIAVTWILISDSHCSGNLAGLVIQVLTIMRRILWGDSSTASAPQQRVADNTLQKLDLTANITHGSRSLVKSGIRALHGS